MASVEGSREGDIENAGIWDSVLGSNPESPFHPRWQRVGLAPPQTWGGVGQGLSHGASDDEYGVECTLEWWLPVLGLS